VVAVRDDLAHQRRVVGRDVVADELGHVGEAHDPVVEVDPLVHGAELDVAHDVVERLEEPLGSTLALLVRRAAGDVPGQVGAGVARPVHQRVPGLAVGGDGAEADRAVLVGDVVGLLQHGGALGAGVLDALVDVRHLERYVGDAVTVPGVVGDHRAARVDATLEHEPHTAALEHEGDVVPVAGLRSRVRDELHAERRLKEVRRLRRVADGPHGRVPPGHREGILSGVVLHQTDQLLQRVQVQLSEALLVGQRVLQ
jgi:hypothetical protein